MNIDDPLAICARHILNEAKLLSYNDLLEASNASGNGAPFFPKIYHIGGHIISVDEIAIAKLGWFRPRVGVEIVLKQNNGDTREHRIYFERHASGKLKVYSASQWEIALIDILAILGVLSIIASFIAWFIIRYGKK